MSFQRTQRVGDLLRKEISEIIRLRMKDPRLGFVTITSVEVSQDLRHAKVYVTSPGSHEELASSVGILAGAAGFIRGELFKRVPLRFIPELAFKADSSIEHSVRISQILRELEDETHRRES
jgi:ribosome-binding factor A